MTVTRREFIRSGVSAFTVSFAAPGFVSDLARLQAATGRNLVILNLSGGNDALSMLVPYNDPFYYSRRPTIAVPAANVLQVGTDSAKNALGLHPKLAGLRHIFDQGRLALIQRIGYENSSRSHFSGTDIWSTANPDTTQGPGWVGRYLDTLPAPVDPLTAWNTTRETPRMLQSRTVVVPAIPSAATYAFSSPNGGAEAQRERTTAARLASHLPIDRPNLAFVNQSVQATMATLNRVAVVAQYASAVTYPNNGFALALKAVAGAMVKGVGARMFFVQYGGFDTHSAQQVNSAAAGYAGLMATLGDGLFAFYSDLKSQGLLDDTLLVSFSEFGRRISENGSQGTDHGAASVMLVMGGTVNGGLYGTAPNLNTDPGNPTLENSAGDVHFETDFRSVYARIIDGWLGVDSTTLLGGNFRKTSLSFL